MSLNEFSLIELFFANTGKSPYPALLSQGDDAAVVKIPAGKQLVMSVDTLVDAVHFPAHTSAADIAYKSLAVNLSDLAAMGATPAWFLLSLTLPNYNESWLAEFSASLKSSANLFEIELIGGDTCQGPLAITIQVNGLVPDNCYITRSGATCGDLIVVSGTLGNAALGLSCMKADIDLPEALRSACYSALNRPRPRLELSSFLIDNASAAIDLSDGLVGDLRHILDKSRVGATIRQRDLPVDPWIESNQAYGYALDGGDDYEICFTIKPEHVANIGQWNELNPDCRLSIIGEITRSGYALDCGDEVVDLAQHKGYQHFA